VTYLVFARSTHDQPLEHQGNLEATSDAAAGTAVDTFGEEWLELILVPLSAARWVTGEPEVRETDV
jgi:hypothetical protein